MKRVYTNIYNLSKSEATAAIAIAAIVVVAYSFWGAHLVASQSSAGSPQVAQSGR